MAEKEAFLTRWAREVNMLSEPDRFVKRRALDTVTRELFEGAQKPPPSIRTSIVLGDLSKPLLALVGDSVESNREAAIALLSRTVEEDLSCSADALVALLPALTARVGRLPVPEEAEELRLQLARLLNSLLCRPGVSAALSSPSSSRIGDVADVVRCLSADAFHSVKVEAANACVHLSAAAPATLHLVLGTLASACAGNMGHQRGPVRLSALSALQACVPRGSEGLPALLSDTVVPCLMALRFDRTPSVRKAAAGTAADWLTSLPPHALAAQEPRLFHLLCALAADDTPEVAEAALAALDKASAARRAQVAAAVVAESGAAAAAAAARASGGGAGAGSAAAVPADLAVAAEAAAPDPSIQGYERAAADAQLTADYLTGRGGGAGEIGEAERTRSDASAGDAHAASAGGGPAAAAAAGILPFPFRRRASPDATWLAHRLLPLVLPPVLAELGDWTARVRLAGAGALRTLVVLSEAGMTPHLDRVLGAFILGSRDEDAEVRKLLGAAGKLVGVLTPPSAQLAILLPNLRGEVPGFAGNVQHAASCLAVLAALLSAMTPASMAPVVPELASTLSLPSLADHEPLALRQQLAAALTFTVRIGVPAAAAAGSLSPETVDALLLGLLHLQDTSAPVELVNVARAVERALAQSAGFGGDVESMYAASAGRLVPRLTRDARSWARGTHSRRVFDTFLRCHRPALCGTSTAQGVALVDAVTDAFVSACEPSKEPELRVALLALLDSLVSGPDEASAHGMARTAAEAAAGQGDGSTTTTTTTTTGTSPTGSHRGQPPTLSAAVAATAGDAAAAAERGAERGAAADRQSALRSALSASGPGREPHSVSDALVDAFLADGPAARIVVQVALPNIVWRVGLVASAVRKVAVAVLLALSRRRLLPLAILGPVALQILPALAGVASDEDATTRQMAVSALGSLFVELRGALDYEGVRALYPELVKRLDDANDSVRLAACAALGAFAGVAPREALRGGPVEYTLEVLLVHLDDAEGGIQAAVYDACRRFVRLDPAAARSLVAAARAKHRHPAYCDKLLAYADSLEGGGGGGAE